MSLERLDTVVVGAGVVGLAVARALAREGRDVVTACLALSEATLAAVAASR